MQQGLNRALPEGATEIAWFEDSGASVGLCEIGGGCWIYGLESAGEDPYAVLRLIRMAHREAEERGYRSVLVQTSRADILNIAKSLGYEPHSILLEKPLWQTSSPSSSAA